MGVNIISGNDARAKIFKGIEKLYEAVSSTLGPYGSTVVIEKPFTYPLITKDGVSVARSISFNDHYENLGVQIVQQVASKTDLAVGDGTTTATVLTYHLYKKCLEFIEKNDMSKLALIKLLDDACDFIIKKIKEHAKKIESDEDLRNIALISANSDTQIADIVYKAFKAASEKGIVTVDINTNPSDEIRTNDGMKIFTGFASPQFVNQKSVSECVLEKPVVYICEDNLLSQADAVHILKLGLEVKKPLLIFAPIVAGEALATFIANKEQGVVSCCVACFPQFGVTRSELVEELTAITGATSISFAAGIPIGASKKEHLGTLKKAVLTINNTLLTRDPEVSDEKVEKIVADIKEKLKTCNINEAAKYSMRLERLCGTIVEVMVGGMTEIEVKERKDRYVDAISAVKAAIECGIVAGGGKELCNIAVSNKFNELYGESAPFLGDVLTTPIRMILESAGLEDQIAKISTATELGYNAMTGELGNLFELGVIDPAKVTMTAITNAFSVVKILLSTNVVMIKED